jgi:hypothetical protein
MGHDSDVSHPAPSSDARERYNHPRKGGERMAKGMGMKKEKKKPKKKK